MCQDKSTPLGSHPWTDGLCSSQPLSAEDTDSQDGSEGLALVGGCTLQKQGQAGHKAGGVLEKLWPHTG